MPNRLAFRIRNDASLLPGVSEKAVEFLEAHGVSPKAAYTLDFILEEIVINVINYGHPDGGEHYIDIGLVVDNGKIEFTCIDEGVEFNPLLLPDADTTSGINERRIGGLGVHLSRKMAESAEYRRIDGRNVLRVVIDTRM